jgi:hypothetical protein
MRIVHLKSAAAAIAFCVMVGTASAAVDFDPATGTGFVGKGDVQLAFGWNNKALQSNASAVTFVYEAVDTYEAECEFYTGPERNRTRHTATETEKTSVAGVPDADPRLKAGQQQFTGFILSGFEGDPSIIGDLPVVGESCKTGAGNQPSQWLSVELQSSTGGLQACHSSNCVVIWSAPLPPEE